MSLIGMNDFVAARFAVPENPIMRGAGVGSLRDFVAGKYVVPENPVMRGAGVGNLVPSAPLYPIPQNSVLTAWNNAGLSGCGGGCGCDSCGGHGMGQTTLSTFTAPFTQAWTDLTAAFATGGSFSSLTQEDWLVIGGTGLALWYLLAKHH